MRPNELLPYPKEHEAFQESVQFLYETALRGITASEVILPSGNINGLAIAERLMKSLLPHRPVSESIASTAKMFWQTRKNFQTR